VASHLEQVSRPQGLFVDTQVTGQPWRGQQRRVRCCVYKRFGKLANDPAPAISQLEAVATTLQATFSEAGIGAWRCTGRALYEWLLPFFNPSVPWARNNADLIAQVPYPGDAQPGAHEAAPIFGRDLAELLNLSQP